MTCEKVGQSAGPRAMAGRCSHHFVETATLEKGCGCDLDEGEEEVVEHVKYSRQL